MSNHTTPNRLASPSGFSFGKLLTPKLRQMINFDSQPVQAGSPEVKKSGLEAYAKKNKLSLPPDFSDLVLECEMELEKEDVSLETITRLTDLYSQAMAYYEAEGSHKYKYFAKKLQDLMLKPNVKETMVREIAPAKSGAEDKELKRMRLESQISKVNTEKEAFTLVKTHEHKEKEIKRVLDGDLNSQKDRIQKRLAQRKVKAQSRAQSVNYLSDDASSTTEEAQAEIDKDASPKEVKNLIKIEEADEADESRYGTPPRRRNKDGQMIVYVPKGNKSLKRLFLEELKKENEEMKKTRGHVRRNSENKAPVLTAVTPGAVVNKRATRAQSFTARNLVHPGFDRLRKTSSNSFEKEVEEHKTESQEQEVKPVEGTEKHEEKVEAVAVTEKHEEEKPKSNNIVEEADEEGSKNGSENNSKSNVEQEEVAVEKNETVGEVVEEKHAGSVVFNEEAHAEEKEEVIVVATPVHAHEEERQEIVQEEKEPEVPVQEVAQEEKQVESVVVEQQEEKEQVEAEPVKENNEVQAAVQEEVVEEKEAEAEAEAKGETIEPVVQDEKGAEVVVHVEEEIKQEVAQEEKEPEASVETEEARQEIAQEEKEAEVPVQVEEEVQQEAAQEEKPVESVAVEQQETKEEAEVETEAAQENNEVKVEETKEVQEVNKEEEQSEPEPAVAVEENTTENVVEAQPEEEIKAEENVSTEVQQEEAQVEVAEVEQKEETKVETENISEPVAEVKEEKTEEIQDKKEEAVAAARRGRTDSEIADEEKIKMLRKIDEEHKLLLEEFISKQTVAKEEATKQVEEKFNKKLQAMEEDMEEEEKLSMMWQKAVAKINKDKETELQKVLETLAQEQTQEVEKYKKKLQQQKMFKLAELED